MRLQTGSILDASTFDGCCHQSGDDDLTVDLSSLRFVLPTGTVRLACVISNAVLMDWPVHFVGPTAWDPGAYLDRVGLASLLDGYGIPHTLPAVNHHEGALSNLVELQRFDTSSQEGYDMADFLVEQVTSDLPNPTSPNDDFQQRLYNGVIEVVDNCVIHCGDATTTAFMAAQVFRSGTSRRVDFSIADTGQGILASFDRSHEHNPTTDVEAINLALTDRVTSIDEQFGRVRGLGLPRMAAQMTEIGGHVRVRSGTGEVAILPSGSAAQTYPISVRGTVVSGSMKC